MKMAIADLAIEPEAAVIDPELTLTCPPGLTAADALSHLVEAFTAVPKNPTPEQLAMQIYVGKNRITDLFCAEGLRLLNRSLGRVIRQPSDLAARSDVMFAAYCVGMAINTTGTASAHAIQSPIAAIGHVAHGTGVGALLPYVMRANLPQRRPSSRRSDASWGWPMPPRTRRPRPAPACGGSTTSSRRPACPAISRSFASPKATSPVLRGRPCRRRGSSSTTRRP